MVIRKKWEGFTSIPLAKNGSPDYCICCLNSMAIRCAWCGESIAIGDPVSLCALVNPLHLMPEYAVGHGEKQFVGCLRWGCADGAHARSGFWNPPGQVVEVPNPIDLSLRGPTGSVVIISDTMDPDDLGKLVRYD